MLWLLSLLPSCLCLCVCVCVCITIVRRKTKNTPLFPQTIIFRYCSSLCRFARQIYSFVLGSSHRHQDNGIAQQKLLRLQTSQMSACNKEAVLLSPEKKTERERENNKNSYNKSNGSHSRSHSSITTIYRQSRNNVLLSRLFPSETSKC